MFDFSSAKNVIQNLVGHVRGLDGQIEALRREREEVAAAPPTKGEVIDQLSDYLARGAVEFQKNFARDLDQLLRKRDNFPKLTTVAGDVFAVQNAIHVLDCAPIGNAPSIASLGNAMFYFLGDVMKSSVEARVNEMPWPAGALDASTRAKRLAELDKKIGALEAEQSKLAQEARAAGISL